MEALKAKYLEYRMLEAESDRLLAMCEADPDDDGLDALGEAAYGAMWDALDGFAAEAERFTGGRIDAATARRLACCPKYSGRLEDLMARWAA